MTKMVHVFRYEGRYIMYPACLSDGLRIGRPPAMSSDADAKPEMLGHAVLQTLEHSKSIPRIDPKDAVKDVLKFFGLKSWAALMKSDAVTVNVTQENGRIEIMPLKNMGPRGGFQPLEGGIRTNAPTTVLVISDQASPQEIGETLLKALSMSR